MEISIRPDVFFKIHSNTLYVVKPINLPKQQIIEKALSFVKNIYVTAWREKTGSVTDSITAIFSKDLRIY